MKAKLQMDQPGNSIYSSRANALLKHLIPAVLFLMLVISPIQAKSTCACIITNTCMPSMEKISCTAGPMLICRVSVNHDFSSSRYEPGKTCCKKGNKTHPVANARIQLVSSKVSTCVLFENESVLFNFPEKYFRRISLSSSPIQSIPIYVFTQSYLC